MLSNNQWIPAVIIGGVVAFKVGLYCGYAKHLLEEQDEVKLDDIKGDEKEKEEI